MSQVEVWKTCTVAAAGKLSATFGSSDPGTHATFDCPGAIGVKFKATAISLPTATKLYVTPRFLDKDGTETFAQDAAGNPAKQVITAINRETEVYWDVDADFVGVEPWLDATDGAATCTLQLKIIFNRA